MANLIIANTCDAECGFCFASSYMKSARTDSFPMLMSLQEFEQALDYLDRSGINEVRLLGGEPTLHPDFPTFVQKARQRGKKVVVFTHGLMPESALQSLLQIPVDQCSLIVNMSAVYKDSQTGTRLEKRNTILEQLGQRAMPGYTIQAPDFALSDVIQNAEETGMRKILRLGLALPGPGSANHFVHPKKYRLIGSQVVRQAKKAASEGFILSFDCGFVRCMFTSVELEELKAYKAQTEWHCSPILDICTAGRVLHCFSLSDRFVLPFSDQMDASALHQLFENKTRAYRLAGVFPECASCGYKASQECSGGCLSATLRRFRPAEFEMDFSRINQQER